MLPVRCYTCNTLIGDKQERWVAGKRAGEPAGQVLEELGLHRMCCRRMFLGYVDVTEDLVAYPNEDVCIDGHDLVLRRRVHHETHADCD